MLANKEMCLELTRVSEYTIARALESDHEQFDSNLIQLIANAGSF